MPEHTFTTAKAVALIAAVGLLPFGVAAVAHLPAEATAEVQTGRGAGQPLGWIAIDTDATPGITLNTGAVTDPKAVETLSGDKTCAAILGGANLLNLRGSLGGDLTAGLASYASGSIGVKEKKSGTSCCQVNEAHHRDPELRLGGASASHAGCPRGRVGGATWTSSSSRARRSSPRRVVRVGASAGSS